MFFQINCHECVKRGQPLIDGVDFFFRVVAAGLKTMRPPSRDSIISAPPLWACAIAVEAFSGYSWAKSTNSPRHILSLVARGTTHPSEVPGRMDGIARGTSGLVTAIPPPVVKLLLLLLILLLPPVLTAASPPPLTQLGPSASVQRSPVNAIKGPTGTGGGRAADNDSPPHPAWRPCSTSDAGDVVVIS